jgi:hypothetical protein
MFSATEVDVAKKGRYYQEDIYAHPRESDSTTFRNALGIVDGQFPLVAHSLLARRYMPNSL